MFQLAIPILIFIAYCFYHIYSRNSPKYWYIIILLFPLIGGIAYLILHMVNKNQVQTVSPTVNIAPTLQFTKIDSLEEEAELSGTVTNIIRLADAYMEKANYEKAVELYISCVSPLTEDDEELNKKLLTAYYSNNDFLNTIQLGEKLNIEKYFQNSIEKTFFAWAYFELHDDEKAEALFKEMNIANTNYYHRKEYAKFLIEIERHEDANVIIEETLDEISYMEPYEQNLIKEKMKEIAALKNRIKIV